MPRSTAKKPEAVKLVEALSNAWQAISTTHREVPPVMLLPAPSHRAGVLGHFAALRWVPQGGERLHEVVVTAEYLDRKPDAVFETLLHEAAHALNHVRGVSDCSASQYHNAHFQRAAEELGLRVERTEHYGFSETSLLRATKKHYATQIDRLGSALVARVGRAQRSGGKGGKSRGVQGGSARGTDRSDDAGGGEDERPGSRLVKATCQCEHIIHASRKVLEATVIRCESCDSAFVW
ncbi:MAG: SprT-like domain-containing protein [Deltaproteobacteria bacterium]